MFKSLPFLPEQASSVAGQVYALFYFLITVSAIFSLLIAALVVHFAIRYRRRSETAPTAAIHGSLALELTWTVIPFCLTMIMFFWGARVYVTLRYPPADAL